MSYQIWEAGGLGPGPSPVAASGASVSALFREHHAELVRLAVLMTGDRASAEDIVQDVFARLCARDQLPDPGGALAYVRAAVLAALAGLSRRRREVLVLRYWLGLPEAEIAAVLGISPGTVKSTSARGIAALARQLGEPA
jgi:DNA-directed RNA polymerase specialized sigma24 family protein